MTNFTERMIRAAKLDVNLYEEVESDTTAMGQAMGVVVLSSLAAGIGSMTTGGPANFFLAAIGALIGWCIWAFLTHWIGTKLLPEAQTKADYGQLLRTIGFSSAPGMLRVLGIIPGFTSIIFAVTGFWMLAAMIIAVRQALDYQSTLRAVGVCLAGWLIQALFLVFLFSMMARANGT